MVELGFLIGIFSYLVFGLGMIGGLGWVGILRIFGVLGILGLIFVKRGRIFEVLKLLKEIKQDKISVILIILFLLSAVVNLIGALGPELGFDALWYHLTIPKIYLEQERIFYIPGGLFYYSAMPKLMEMLYLTTLTLSKFGILAKLIHFSFGILCAISLYQLSRKFLNKKLSLFTTILFYTSLIVGWESITAYVDLGRTFFEILALKLFLDWGEERNKGNKEKGGNIKLYESAIMLGLAVSTKLIALVSLPIFLFLVLYLYRFRLKAGTTKVFLFAAVTFLTVAPWMYFSYRYTGNLIYPIFSGILDSTHQIPHFNLILVAKDLWQLFYHPQDLISPLFLIFLPIVFFRVVKGGVKGELRVLGTYCFFALVFWYFIPRTGGSRFILPYLPALSLLIVWTISLTDKFYKNSLYVLVFVTALVNTGYRFLANKKFIPVVFGSESRDIFLANNLKFNMNEFYDLNGDLKNIIKNDDLVLVYGSHNLFYMNTPFIHESYAQPGTLYSYILTQGTKLPRQYGRLKNVYKNTQSGVALYIYGGEKK